jgi:hypothetical protein
MTLSLKLSIADIIILLTAEDGIRIIKDNDPYYLFLTEGKPEVTLRFQHSSDFRLDRHSHRKTIFDSTPSWNLFYSDRRYILETRFHTMVIKPDFTSGTVYIDKERNFPPFTYPLDEIFMINLLGRGCGILVHACGIKNSSGEGLLFAGISGAGKSTTANLWMKKAESDVGSQKLPPEDITVLSDDRIIIRKNSSRFRIYGTPWHGDAKVCSPEKFPLKKIFFLEHASENFVRSLNTSEAMSRLLVRSFPPFWDSDGMEFTLKFIEELAGEVPCYDLGFLPDTSVIDFVNNI